MIKMKSRADILVKLSEESASEMQPTQVAKHYFGDYPSDYRNRLIKQFNVLPFESTLNEYMHDLRKELNEEISKALPSLAYSIVLNSLSFEANEDLGKTIMKDYKSKAIKQHAKPFINAQYISYRNSYEQLFEITEEAARGMTDNIEDVIKFITEVGLNSIRDMKGIYQAYLKDEKSIMGIVKKVNAR